MIKKVNVQKLPPNLQPKFGVEPADDDKINTIKSKLAHKLNKSIKGMFEKSLNVKNIVKGLDLDQSDYINDTNNTTFAGGSSNLSLQMGVNLNKRDQQHEGPEFRISNRMTLNQYKIISKSRGNPTLTNCIDNNKMRYSAAQSPEASNVDKDFVKIKEESTMDNVSVTKFRRKITKDNERIIGDLSKARMIPDANLIDRKVVFYPINSDASMAATNQLTHKRRLTNQKYDTQSVDMFGGTKSVRPFTAKNHYKVIFQSLTFRM
jgi:hypothetical protein